MAICEPYSESRSKSFLAMVNIALSFNEESETRVVCCNDHKGGMVCYWSDLPCDEDMATAQTCWGLCGESEIDHVYLQPVGPESNRAAYLGLEGRATRSSN